MRLTLWWPLRRCHRRRPMRHGHRRWTSNRTAMLLRLRVCASATHNGSDQACQ